MISTWVDLNIPFKWRSGTFDTHWPVLEAYGQYWDHKLQNVYKNDYMYFDNYSIEHRNHSDPDSTTATLFPYPLAKKWITVMIWRDLHTDRVLSCNSLYMSTTQMRGFVVCVTFIPARRHPFMIIWPLHVETDVWQLFCMCMIHYLGCTYLIWPRPGSCSTWLSMSSSDI